MFGTQHGPASLLILRRDSPSHISFYRLSVLLHKVLTFDMHKFKYLDNQRQFFRSGILYYNLSKVVVKYYDLQKIISGFQLRTFLNSAIINETRRDIYNPSS